MSSTMRRRLKLLSISLGIYILFVVRGLASHHYVDWSLDYQIGDCFEIIIFSVPIAYGALRWASTREHFLSDSVWFGIFLSVPFAMVDTLLLGVHRGYGVGYLHKFWFLVIIFYFITPIEMPLVGYLMHRSDKRLTLQHLTMLLIAVACWLLNYWEGQPSHHYASWTLDMKIARLGNVMLILPLVVVGFLCFQSARGRYHRDSLWSSGYLTFLFVHFDFIYLGVARGHGLRYLTDYWFVSPFYLLFCIEVPLIGWGMDSSSRASDPLLS